MSLRGVIPIARFAGAAASLAAFVGAAVFPAHTALAQTPTVIVTNDPTYGPIITDPSGMTLYLWEGDTPGVSNCYDNCAVSWPPLFATSDLVAPPGLPGTLSAVTRNDGTMIVAYNDWPLYYYRRDVAPGDVVGQDSNSAGARWAVIQVEQMAPAEAPASQPAPATPPQAAPAPASIPLTIADFRFEPASVEVHVGDTVVFANHGNAPHTSTSDAGMWDSHPLNPGQTSTVTFTSAGTFAYHCAIHSSMHGTITVTS